jgi:integrase/recombinase XerD
VSKPRKIPRVLSERERRRLLAGAHHRQRTWVRNELLLRIILNCGLRSAESLSLKVGDLNLKEGSLMVMGKGKKERKVYPNDENLAALEAFCKGRKKREFIFVTKSGRPLQTRYLRRLVVEAAHRSKMARRIHPHLLRHTCATELYKKTKDIRLVQDALGHQNIQTTQIYTHIYNEDVKIAMKGLK